MMILIHPLTIPLADLSMQVRYPQMGLVASLKSSGKAALEIQVMAAALTPSPFQEKAVSPYRGRVRFR
jgi:hypothetical protein